MAAEFQELLSSITYWGMGVQLKAFQISALHGGKQSLMPQAPYPTYRLSKKLGTPHK
jgi:hypothetical protein